jgi:hypothetical protein
MNRIWIPQLVVSGMFVWGLNSANPYEYYILLRWVCCAAFAYLALQASAFKQQGWVWILGVTAAIYNPIVPVHLTRGIWSVINVVSTGIAVTSIFAVKPHEETHPTAPTRMSLNPRRREELHFPNFRGESQDG